MSPLVTFFPVFGAFFTLYLFKILNLNNNLNKISPSQISKYYHIHLILFLIIIPSWITYSVKTVTNEWGIVYPIMISLIIIISYFSLAILFLFIAIFLKAKKDKKFKNLFFKYYKIQLIIFISTVLIILLITLFSLGYKIIKYKQDISDRQLAKKAVQKNNPNLCNQAYDSFECYYLYARGSMDKSFCKREFVGDKIAACNQIGRYGSNFGKNFTYWLPDDK